MFPQSTLSFRSFHEKHFSSVSQATFFAAAAQAEQDAAEGTTNSPELEGNQLEQEQVAPDEKYFAQHVEHLRAWLRAEKEWQQYQWQYQYYEPYWEYRYPTARSWHGNHQEVASQWWPSLYQPHGSGVEESEYNVAVDGAENAVDEAEGAEDNQETVDDEAEPLGMTLTPEAIAIFEFSRKFREQKAAAAKLEKEKEKRQRAKRRRAAMLGFANSELAMSEEEDECAEDNTGRSIKRSKGSDSITNGDDDEEDEDGIGYDDNDDHTSGSWIHEPPANDTSFLSVPPLYYERLQNKLYGGSLKELEKQAQQPDPLPSAAAVIPQEKAQRAVHELLQIQYLESLLDRAYEDSLQPSASSPNDDSVALWPGMPLRC